MNCEIPLRDPREPVIRAGDTVTITAVDPKHLTIEVEDGEGSFTVHQILRKSIGSA